MFTKAIVVAVSALSHIFSLAPPTSSRTVSESKDKVKVEGRIIDSRNSPCFFIGLTLAETVVYLLLMYLGQREHNHDIVAIKRLEMLEPWHVVFTLVALSGLLLRRWSYRTLDRFFTYQLTIRPGHKLVQEGPYRLLLHPAYTGASLNAFAAYMVLWYKGLWNVAAWYLGRFTDHHHQQQEHAGLMELFVPALYGAFMIQMFLCRYKKEEKMLREHFGEEWDEYASKRWRFIPYVY
ncbi:hypothetical protein BGZ47_003796 [Haplosporangium gracile]|nr:hypothetical protein BGZ47_003796 [Haplosporangium gracile]